MKQWEVGGEPGRMLGAEREGLFSPIHLEGSEGWICQDYRLWGGQAWCASSFISGTSGK